MMSRTVLICLTNILISMPELDTINNWNVLKDDGVWVGWIKIDGNYWCESHKLFPYTINEISKIVSDKGNYSSVFKRIVESTAYDNIVHIKLDMPFPFSSRDYIVEYTEETIGKSIYYNWTNTTKLEIPVDKNYVRLINAEGQWELVEEGNNTYVYYRWNGELRGDFPSWALTRAWKEQGSEVLLWLEESLENSNK